MRRPKLKSTYSGGSLVKFSVFKVMFANIIALQIKFGQSLLLLSIHPVSVVPDYEAAVGEIVLDLKILDDHLPESLGGKVLQEVREVPFAPLYISQ